MTRGRGARFGGFLARHRDRIHQGADLGAKTAGVAWAYVLLLYASVLLITWILTLIFRHMWLLVLAIALTIAIVPPMRRELRHRDEVRRTMKQP